jgi:hypothetical protein
VAATRLTQFAEPFEVGQRAGIGAGAASGVWGMAFSREAGSFGMPISAAPFGNI